MTNATRIAYDILRFPILIDLHLIVIVGILQRLSTIIFFLKLPVTSLPLRTLNDLLLPIISVLTHLQPTETQTRDTLMILLLSYIISLDPLQLLNIT